MSFVLLHCQPSLKEWLIDNNIPFRNSAVHGDKELDAIVEDIDYNPDHEYVDPDEQFCYELGIDYDQLNCIEASDLTQSEYEEAMVHYQQPV